MTYLREISSDIHGCEFLNIIMRQRPVRLRKQRLSGVWKRLLRCAAGYALAVDIANIRSCDVCELANYRARNDTLGHILQLAGVTNDHVEQSEVGCNLLPFRVVDDKVE